MMFKYIQTLTRASNVPSLNILLSAVENTLSDLFPAETGTAFILTSKKKGFVRVWFLPILRVPVPVPVSVLLHPMMSGLQPLQTGVKHETDLVSGCIITRQLLF